MIKVKEENVMKIMFDKDLKFKMFMELLSEENNEKIPACHKTKIYNRRAVSLIGSGMVDLP